MPSQPAAIQEALETGFSHESSSRSSSPSRKSLRPSILTEMIRSQPHQGEEAVHDAASSETEDEFGPVTVGHAIISQPHERTPLIQKNADDQDKSPAYKRPWDLESLLVAPRRNISAISSKASRTVHQTIDLARVAMKPAAWDRRKIWQNAVLQPAGFVPAIVLGLLLNVLDALSYGKPLTLQYWNL